MKFLCLPCDHVMEFSERSLPGDGTLAAVFRCGGCGREMAMLTNPMETQLVSSLGVKVGGREVPEQPMELVRSSVAGGRADAFDDGDPGYPRDTRAPGDPGDPHGSEETSRSDTSGGDTSGGGTGGGGTGGGSGAVAVFWSDEALERLGHVPSFVRGMVKRIYADYARERGIAEITPGVMDTARSDLGLEGM